MNDTSKILVGHVYGNGKGQYRKVRDFRRLDGRRGLHASGCDILYVRCTETGAVTENAKEQACWVTTFLSWAKTEHGPVGNLNRE